MDRHADDDHHLIPVGAKLRRQRGSMMRESASAPVSHFARTQLERMGWTEGTGLGKRQDGMTTHIKVKQRKEASGIGAEKVALAQQQKEAVEGAWWMDAVGHTLAKLGGGGADVPAARWRRRVTDEELFVATGGARFGMRAGKTRNLDKWKRVDDNHHQHQATTTTTTSARTGPMEPGSDAAAQKHGAPLDAADDAVNHNDHQPQQKKKTKKKRKARDSSADVDDVENDMTVRDEDEDQKKKKSFSRKRSKKDKKSKKEKKEKKEKKREKRS